MSKKLIILVLILFIAIAAFFVLSKAEVNKHEKPIIKIGVTLPLSGDVSFAGVPVKKSIELSLDDLKKERNLQYDYQLVFEDDKLDSKNILLNYNRFKGVNKVNAVISMWGNALPISLQTDRDKIIHLGCSWGYEIGKGKFNLNHSTLPDEQTEYLIKELKKRNVKKLGFIYNSTAGDQELSSILLPLLENAGIEVVFQNMFMMNHKDFRTDIIKMKEKEIDILLLMLVSPGMENFMKQSLELGYTPAMTTFNYFAYNPGLFEGQWFIDDAVGTPEFIKHFTETTQEPAGSCVANLYDGLSILVNGFENTPAETGSIPSNEDVIETILSMKNFEKALKGTYIDEEGNVHSIPSVKIIKDGKSVLIGGKDYE